MNPETPEDARKIFSGIKRVAEKLRHTEAVVCPPFVYLSSTAKLATPKTKVGAQDVFWEQRGSYTGEVSATMVRGFGGTHVIVGHSERRALGETDDAVAKKVAAVIREDLTAIICIGESARDSHGEYFSFIKEQLSAALSGVQKKHLFNIVIAYEPVWAIGKSEREALTGTGMHEMGIFIRKVLSDLYGREFVSHIPVLYGGSVTPTNTADIVREGRVDGLLVGRQSLDPKQFAEILKIVESIPRME